MSWLNKSRGYSASGDIAVKSGEIAVKSGDIAVKSEDPKVWLASIDKDFVDCRVICRDFRRGMGVYTFMITAVRGYNNKFCNNKRGCIRAHKLRQ